MFIETPLLTATGFFIELNSRIFIKIIDINAEKRRKY